MPGVSPGDLVDVYVNLNELRKGTLKYSIRANRRVKGHLPAVTLEAVTFTVKPGALARIRTPRGVTKAGAPAYHREVCAWGTGRIVAPGTPVPATPVEVNFDPFGADTFYRVTDHRPVYTAAIATFASKRVFISEES